MIARHLRVEGLPRAEVEERLSHHPTEPALDALDEVERARLLDLLAPSGLAGTRPAERFAAALRLFAALGARRPIVLVFDDAQLAHEPIELAEHVLRLRDVRLPALVVLTVQEEALEEREHEAALLDALAAQPGCARIELGLVVESARVRMGVADVARRRGELDRAVELARKELSDAGRRGYVAFALAGLWACAAARRDWGVHDVLARELTELLDELPVVDDDLAWLLDRAARLAAPHDRERARPALALALAQWKALGRADEARALEAAVG